MCSVVIAVELREEVTSPSLFLGRFVVFADRKQLVALFPILAAAMREEAKVVNTKKPRRQDVKRKPRGLDEASLSKSCGKVKTTCR